MDEALVCSLLAMTISGVLYETHPDDASTFSQNIVAAIFIISIAASVSVGAAVLLGGAP